MYSDSAEPTHILQSIKEHLLIKVKAINALGSQLNGYGMQLLVIDIINDLDNFDGIDKDTNNHKDNNV